MSLLLDRFALFYPMRVVASVFMVVVTTLDAWHNGGFDAYHVALACVLVVYPHVVHYIARKYPQNRRGVELRTFLFDSFIGGVVVHTLGFAPLPTFVLITGALASALSVNGLRQMLLSAASVLAGALAYGLFAGFNFSARDSIALDVVSSVFTFVYFMAFAYSSHNRSALLQHSETELRERTASLEIEKRRSDRLLFNLVPARLAAQMTAPGGIRPMRFDPVVLLAAELRGFSRALHAGVPDEVLAHLMHCFKAFDAIADRFGLEKLKTMGDTYIAVAGLPVPGEHDGRDTVEAALQMREFLVDLAAARRAHGEFVLDARIAVHAGSVIGCIVETSKVSYDIFGDAMKTLLGLLRACDDGGIAVSDAARKLAGDGYDWVDMAAADSGTGRPVHTLGASRPGTRAALQA